MAETLKIEIEAENKEKLHALLKHIYKEITVGTSYSETEIDNVSKLDDTLRWLVIEEGKFKGKYRWSTIEILGE